MKAWLLTLVAVASFQFTLGAEPWTLERAIEYALAHNPDARIAQHRIAASQAGLAQANSAFWPKLQLQSSYSRTDNPMLAFGSILNQRSFNPALNFNNGPETDDVNVRGIITAPLYAGGRNIAERDAAKSNSRAAKYEQMAVRNTLQFEVVRTFHTILKTRQFVRSVEATVHSYETNLVIAQRRLEAGTLLKADVLDFEVRLAQGQENLVAARNANLLAERALRNLLGVETTEEFVVADTVPNIEVPSNGGAERPELLALRQRQEAAMAKLRGARSGYKPRVSAFGNIDYDYGTITRGDGRSYAGGIVAQWDLWDGFSTRSKISEAEANLDSLREEERKLKLSIDLETEEAKLNLAAANERLFATEKGVSLASESLTLTRNRFEQGSALPTQIIDAESALLAARVRRAEAESDQRISIGALRKALAAPQIEHITGAK
jgi:outer membrane protein TolC